MTEWEPATEVEAAMRDALRAGDQELYFRILARSELLLPVSADALAGRAPMGWGTWTTGGRTHVLAFTSGDSLRLCLADNAGSARRVAYHELAGSWPNLEWWLAVNPGLPIEGYLPAWFVSQLARGDVRLPGRTMGARARLERAESVARARATAVVPGQVVPPEPPAGARAAAVPPVPPVPPGPPVPPPAPPPGRPTTLGRISRMGDAPARGESRVPTRPAAAEPPSLTGRRPPTGLAASPSDARSPVVPPLTDDRPVVLEPGPEDIIERGASFGARPVPPVVPGTGGYERGRPEEWPSHRPPATNGGNGSGNSGEFAAWPGSDASPGARPDARGDRRARGGFEEERGEFFGRAPSGPERPAWGSPDPEPRGFGGRSEAQSGSEHPGGRPGAAGYGGTGEAGPPADPAERGPEAAAGPSFGGPQAGPTGSAESGRGGLFGGEHPSDDTAHRDAETTDVQPVEAQGPREDTSPRVPSTTPPTVPPTVPPPAQPPIETPAAASQPTATPRPDPIPAPAEERRPEPEPARARTAADPDSPFDGAAGTDFVPANDVEESLLAAAGEGSTDTFLSTLLLARVLLPVAAESATGARPGTEGFVWRTETIDGESYLVVFTSPERLADHLGEETDTVTVKFVSLISRWPYEAWSFAVNPGTPVGAKLPGAQIVALANWAAEVGLAADDDVAQPAPAPEEEAPPAPEPEQVVRPLPTMMQKAIAPSQVDYYLDRGYDRVSGFVHRVEEVAHLTTPARLFTALGLGYPDSPFKPDADEVYVLRWAAHRPSLYRIPYGGQNETAMRAMEGWVIERAPFRGNGFAPGDTSDVIAEFKVDSARLPHGAELWRIAGDGTQMRIAVLDADAPGWQRVGEG